MWRALVVCTCLAIAACGESRPGGGPSPPVQIITGAERIGWDQPASTAADLAALRYLLYVDDDAHELTDVACGSAPGTAGYACSARLPSMSRGPHVLKLAAFVDAAVRVEGAQSPPLAVVVGGPVAASTADATALRVTTNDGLQLRADAVADGLTRRPIWRLRPTAATSSPSATAAS
jgi:hypothetical protein